MFKKIGKEFTDFAMRGNVVDLAVGVILGAAFGKIVQSLVKDVIMPPIGQVLGKVDFSNLYLNLSPVRYATLAEAQKAGAPTLNYGLFLNEVVNFVIVAAAVFLMIRQFNRLKPPPPPSAPADRECPFCLSRIPMKAARCAHCTSSLN